MRNKKFHNKHQIQAMSGRKRSLSPTGRPSRHDWTSSGVDGLKRVFGFLSGHSKPEKKVTFKSNFGLGESKPSEATDTDISSIKPDIEFSASDNDILSDKRRRISVQYSNNVKSSVPRGSIDYNAKAVSKYGDYLQKIHQQTDEDASGLEKRASLSVNELDDNGEYNSPIPDMTSVRRQSTQMINALEKTDGSVPEGSWASEESEIEGEASEDDGALVNFAPLYRDEEGNLVRPPFINLAPKERYQLLELKKSLDMSKAIQARLKYTINPHEAASILLSNNKVETATQTQDLGYLRKKLHFNAFIDRRDDNAHSKRKKLGNGAVFSGEFLYDVEEPKDKPNQDNKLNGYLGSISKPKFDDKGTGRKEFLSESTIKLDSEYLTKKEKLSEKIKIKDDEIRDKSTVKPSQGFEFSINKTKLDDIINKNNEVDKKPETQTQTAKAPGAEDKAPKFSFGGEKSTEAPKISFGGNKKDETAPKISFGGEKENDETPKFSFGSANKSETPKFSFGGEKKSETQTISFGADKKEEPTFGGDKKAEAPKFSFGEGTKKDESSALGEKKEAPKFSFGAASSDKTEMPKLSFGGSALKKDDSTANKPAFSFGDSKASSFGDNKASSLFGTSKKDEEAEPKRKRTLASSNEEGAQEKKEAPKLSFGSASGTDDKPKATPSFNFGSSAQKEAPKFSFGSTSDKTEATFNLGSKDTSGPKLTFDQKPEEKEAPKFSFGAASSKESTPAATLGSNTTLGSTGATTGSTTATAGSTTKPAFSFGTAKTDKEGDKSKTPAPSFTFGASVPANKEEGDKASSTAGTSLFGTTGAKTTTTAPTFGSNGGTGFTKAASPFNFGAVEKPAFTPTPTAATGTEKAKSPFDFGATSKPTFPGATGTAVPQFSASVPPPSTSPFNFGAVQAPKLQTASPFNRDSTPGTAIGTGPTTAPSNIFGGGNSGASFPFANGITPIKPTVPNTNFGGFNREATPSQFNFSRSGTGTPEFGFQQQQQPQAGFGAQPFGNMGMGATTPMGMSHSAPMNGASPMDNGLANRPNRKIARMRKRRT